MKVYLINSDVDFHGSSCRCGKCDSNGKSTGIAIRKFHCECGGSPDCYHEDMLDEDFMNESAIEVVYGSSEESALHNARLICKEKGYKVIE